MLDKVVYEKKDDWKHEADLTEEKEMKVGIGVDAKAAPDA